MKRNKEELEEFKNRRAKALYELLSYGALSKEDIMKALPLYFPKADDTYLNNCPDFYEAKERANFMELGYLIVKKENGKWGFGTREEIIAMINSKKERARKLCIEANNLIKESRLDGVSYMEIKDCVITGEIKEKHTVLEQVSLFDNWGESK